MNIKQRRILYIFFVLIFLISTPLISLYATGYKISNGFKIEKTGALIIDTKPQGAKIFLNGKIQKKFLKNIFKKNKDFLKSPVKIKGLKPGEYDIKLELSGYYPWEKKLNIYPGQSTYIEDVNLFKNELPIIISNGKYSDFLISPKSDNIIAFDEKNIKLIKENGFKIENFILASSTLENKNFSLKNSSFSPDKENIIISEFIFNEDRWNNPFSLKKIIGNNIKKIEWMNNDTVCYQKENSLYSFNISSEINKNILTTQEIDDYFIKDNFLYLIENNKNSSHLNIWDLKNEKYIRKINLPKSKYKFISKNNELVNLYDYQYHNLYLIDPFSEFKPLRETINNISEDIIWVNKNKLLYHNDFEIWIMDFNNGNSVNKTLITRISDKIKKVFWHPSDNYIFYVIKDKIKSIELDKRNNYNINKIIQLKNIKNIIFNSKGDIIFFYAQIANQEGIYKLYIQ